MPGRSAECITFNSNKAAQLRQACYTSANSTTLIAARAAVPPLVPTEAAAEYDVLLCQKHQELETGAMPPLPGPPAVRPLEAMVPWSDVGRSPLRNPDPLTHG